MGCCYVLCTDGEGKCVVSFVYCIFIIAHGVLFYTVIYPELGTDGQSSALIEYGFYLVFWTLMVSSHIATMCVDPGFIKEGYQYDEKVLCAPFTNLEALESAYLNVK